MNLLILLYLFLITPKLLWDRVRKGKRHPGLLQRLGISIPKADRPVIWIHAVSVGEVKAAQPLFYALREQQKGAFFLITTTSATGQAEAKRSLPEADAFAYLPIDLSWVVRKWVKHLDPKLFILVESDFWYNLLSALKKNGTQIALVSGKLSERSARRFQTLAPFSKRLFSLFDSLCVQNEIHFRRFQSLHLDPSRIHITGNLKLDLQPQPISQSLEFPFPVITISCTHPSEEELLLDALKGKNWCILLVPRHPERFEEVAQLLQKKNLPFSRWTQTQKTERILLVDAMGQLPNCYAHSRLAIVAGSYVDHVGGHNVLEPCLYGTPVIFGPHMYGQSEFAQRALESGAGEQIPLDKLGEWVSDFFEHPEKEKAMREAAFRLVEKGRGTAVRTLDILLDRKKKLWE